VVETFWPLPFVDHDDGNCYDFERFRLFAAMILASRLRLSVFETEECLCCQRYCLKFVELVQVFIKD